MAEILHNLDGSKAVITKTSSGRLCIAEGQTVYQAAASVRALVHASAAKAECKKPDRPAWAINLRRLMRERGLTQSSMQGAFGVSTTGAVGHYLAGRREPSIGQIISVCKALRISVSELVGEAPASKQTQGRTA
jgi:hypothetical protein